MQINLKANGVKGWAPTRLDIH